jgi:2-polyprenyl-6-methoxyphenol hydroxylase-like FAD-dependent oxidoreductase
MTSTDVLIVGAGPTGLTLANELLRHGAGVRIVDKAAEVAQSTKALGVQARTLEQLEGLGVSDAMVSRGLRLTKARIFSEHTQIADFDFGRIDSPYPYLLELPQNHVEEILADRLAEQGGRIDYSTELLTFDQGEDGVEATLRHADGREERSRFAYLVACDGARSLVRHQLGVDFEGSTFDQSFAVADVRLEWPLDGDALYAFLNRGAFMAFFPMADGLHRVAIAYRAGSEPAGEVDRAELERGLAQTGPPGAAITEVHWTSRFRINQRRAARQALGRVFLAGDAAHIHSLIGAQGMNTGIQDAVNLAWKLARVLDGRAPRALLESYQPERGEVSRRLLKATGRVTRMTLLRNPVATAIRRTVAPRITSRAAVQDRLPFALSQTDVAYPDSPLNTGHGTPAPGERAPDAPLGAGRIFELLRGTGYVLLSFDGRQDATAEVEEAVRPYGEEIAVHRITADQDPRGEARERYGCVDGGFVLIRPDHHIAVRGGRGEVHLLRDHLARWLTPSRDEHRTDEGAHQ